MIDKSPAWHHRDEAVVHRMVVDLDPMIEMADPMDWVLVPRIVQVA